MTGPRSRRHSIPEPTTDGLGHDAHRTLACAARRVEAGRLTNQDNGQRRILAHATAQHAA